jgi:predicted transcriptional regulator of viral defense system
MQIQKQSDFLKYLDNEEIQLFNIENLKKSLGYNGRMLNEIVENLVRIGFLHRLERGKYCRSTFRDENVIGTFLAQDSAVAYWSALHLHGLTEQFSNTIFVQTIKKKITVSVLGADYQFIKINSQKRTGIIYNGYGNYKYPITDIEKTITDCFDLPQYSGGFAELIRAFCQVNFNVKKLIKYCDIVNNIAAIKRMGFLAELFEKDYLVDFILFAKSKINRTYNLFDPFGKSEGNPNSEWYLRLNVSKEDILRINQNLY